MTVRVGINGFGRIGRNFFRAVRASGADIEIVGVNDLTDNKVLAHLLKFDTILGRLDADVTSDETSIKVGDQNITAFAERDPSALKWGDIGADVVVESTGFFTDATKAHAHIDAGAKKVIISAPATNEDFTVVMGVNDGDYDPEKHHVISNASCTTNCLAPMAKALHDEFRHRQGPDDDDPRLHGRPEPAGQHPQGPAPCPRRRAQRGARPRPVPRRRSAWCCPSSRASSTATRSACRCRPARPPTSPSRPAARPRSRRSTPPSRRPPTVATCATPTDPIVSSDIVTDPASCIFDAPLTKVIGNQVKVVGWYDNEWGYSNRLADLITYVGESL